MFADDDNFVNPKLVITYLKNLAVKEAFYAGYVFRNSAPIRNFNSKWHISLVEYPYEKYPAFVSGNFFILNARALTLFDRASKTIKLFKFDDVYLGMLAYNLGIKPVHLKNVYFFAPTSNINIEKTMAAHRFTKDNLSTVWNKYELLIRFEPTGDEDYFLTK